MLKRINNFVRGIRKKMLGSLESARRDGMQTGSNTRVMGGVDFGSEPYLITLGDDITISFGVHFVTHDGGTWAFRDMDEYENIHKFGRIRVGSHSFVWGGTIILPGVTIGERCVIGAGSVVTRDVPDGTVVAGVPARVIMTTAEYAQKCQANMVDFDPEQYNENKKNYLLRWCK